MSTKRMTKKKTNIKHQSIIWLLLLVVLFLGEGYAAVNSVSLSLEGASSIGIPEDIYITDVGLTGNNYSDVTFNTTVSSHIELSPTDGASTLVMPVTIYNNTDYDTQYLSLNYDTGFYDNNNITFSTDAVVGDTIAAHTSSTYNVTFAYNAGVVPSSSINTLNSYLHFEFGIAGSHSVTFYGDESGDHGFATSVASGSTYVADFGSVNHRVPKVLMGGVELAPTAYTFANNVLTIPNVTGDLVIYAADVSQANYVLDPSAPAVSIPISGVTKLNQLYNRIGFDAVNASDILITSITVSATFTAQTNSAQVVDCILSVNGSETKRIQLSFSRNAASPLVGTFDSLSIGFEDVIAISYASNSVNNGKITVTNVTTTVHYANS